MNDSIENDGIILVDKPAGISSFGVVARVRGALTAAAGRKIKVGHTGTLDPFATGLMLLVVGPECRNASAYSKLDKVYQATVTLGATSTTGDPEGELISGRSKVPTASEVTAACTKFVGDITQTPPAYSAIKIGGRRAYQLARQGQAVEIPPRQVTVHSLVVDGYAYPDIRITVHVSSGTYIRTLAADIGDALGTGAYCSALRRTAIGQWRVSEARTLEDLAA